MTRETAEFLKVARELFRPGVLMGVVSTGDGKEERGHCFMVCEPTTGVAIGVKGAAIQVFKLSQQQIQTMRGRGDLLSTLDLGAARVFTT